ncbi:aspartate aminotransferase family protein [Chondrinema litorale]|uniref:aspartate aminotransferase family protein n=1 Tax=Chondrinema litorale TaxID=2994555 RepID=UPI002542E043|nr:aminotransferase class III-fold pyridoxal phosphate-dependent enzyme [Chondrinema litorale]UZR93437.1 aminotransferase class III-fold pyridoxal phosphate-dependent enzyme [Chondrinema litorale]
MFTERQLFLNHIAQTSDFPLMVEIEKAKGIYMYDKYGKKYMDLISGIGVSNLGHLHPAVVKAVKKQVDKYMHLMVYGEFVETPQVKLAKLLSDLLPQSLNSVYLVNSGTEAVEGALKLAKRFTGRTEIISAFDAYHGATQGSLSICGNEPFKNAFRPLLPDVKHIQFNKAEDLELITEKTAAVIVETIQGEAGIRVPDKDYMKQLRQQCTDKGCLLIFDEIQAGIGRTGNLWGFEHFGVVPDILLLAKGLGGGMPIGAFISDVEIMKVFKNNPILGHITTFGGHPVSAAAAYASLKTVSKSKIYQEAKQKGKLFKKLLKHDKIKEVRGKGLMLAAEFDSFDTLKPIIDKALQNGILTDWFLFCDNSMRIAPPLIIKEKHIRKACGVILDILG